MTEQRPIGSGFGAATTAGEVIADEDLTGKVALVTGGYSGLGLETARALASAGAEVVVPARDAARARATVQGQSGIELETLELTDPASIDALAERFLASGRPLHLLINNAGVMATPLSRDARGYEHQFSTNHLGHFQLTARLWPALRKAAGARVVQLTSRGHARAGVDFDDLQFERREYDPGVAYGQSKTANALFALELDARGHADGVRAFSVHPGGIVTNLGRHTAPELMKAFGMIDEAGQPIIDPASDRKTPMQGAATTIWCAVSAQLNGQGGVYCEDCDIAPAVAADAFQGPGVRPWAMDLEAAKRLWSVSESLTGARFG